MLAASGLTHCSLSSESVFVDAVDNVDDDDDQQVRVRVGGLGLQHDMDNEELIELARNMPEWMAPEMLQSGRCSEKSDMWAFGVLAWELYSGGVRPYAELGGSCELLEEHICVAQQRLPRPESCPEELFKLLMQQCWQKAARKRLTFCELHKQLVRIFPMVRVQVWYLPTCCCCCVLPGLLMFMPVQTLIDECVYHSIGAGDSP